jgi:hypothetical protein
MATRYVLAYFGNELRGPFDFATEAAIAAVFVIVGNPEGLEIVPIADDTRPTADPLSPSVPELLQ